MQSEDIPPTTPLKTPEPGHQGYDFMEKGALVVVLESPTVWESDPVPGTPYPASAIKTLSEILRLSENGRE